MNIFYLHPDPYEAAAYHYDKHKVKMILEAAQMLCTAHRMYNLEDECEDIPYKKAHVNHPSTIWARQSGQNYYWLYHYMLALGDEYTKRYGKIHLTITKCKKPLEIMNNPWKNAYTHPNFYRYSIEEIDEMLMCELEEIYSYE